MTDPGMQTRVRLTCHGRVQGVGLRPFVHRLATDLGLTGWVANTPGGVIVEVQGAEAAVMRFDRELPGIPPPARIERLRREERPLEQESAFVIAASQTSDAAVAAIAPDLATCPACRAELFDPAARRYRYPFITCSHCGPRWSILQRLPFDRVHTAMARFALCRDCRAEYADPADRRFHAQTLACPACGPRLAWHDAAGRPGPLGDAALAQAIVTLRAGGIVAVKGVGGIHLLVDARNGPAVARLRARKARPAKPLAVMFPDLAQLRRSCDVSMAEAALLQSALAPIVLLARRADDPLCAALAPGLDRLGALLPYSPLHHLLLETLGFPVVATSANRSGAPLCFDNDHALTALQGIAEGFLLHDRPIVRPVEDSVAQVFEGEAMMLRLGRGRVPEELRLPRPVMPVLAVGGQWKNGLAVTVADRLVVGGYRGDLDHPEAQTAWAQECMTLPALFGLAPQRLACDLHPDYVPTRLATAQAEREGLTLIAVQHHHAHLAAAVLEAALPDPLLGVVWDGTGLGTDRTVWGGELLAWEAGRARRVGTLIPFQLPGGDAAMADPRRTALGVLEALGEPLDGAWASRLGFEVQTLRSLGRMLETGTACVTTTSAGRLFDAMAALLGRTDPVTYEGEAAMALETLARSWRGAAAPYAVSSVADEAGLIHMDWRMALRAALADCQAGKSTAAIAAHWHLSLAALIAQAVARLDTETVVLAGGCFQNTLLLGHTVRLLRGQGRRVFWPQRLPVNDGALAAGQAALAAGVWEEG